MAKINDQTTAPAPTGEVPIQCVLCLWHYSASGCDHNMPCDHFFPLTDDIGEEAEDLPKIPSEYFEAFIEYVSQYSDGNMGFGFDKAFYF